MFVYNANLNLSLRAYGIMVPMLDQRVEIIREWAQKQVDLGILKPEALVVRDFAPADEKTLELAHDHEFVRHCLKDPAAELIKTYELIDERGNFYRYYPDKATKDLGLLMDTVRKQVSGSIFSAELALSGGFAFFLGGGLHHAMSFAGRGFCQFNDIVIAARHLQKNKGVRNVWVVDIDAHKGDGTAQILKDDPSISTFSIHMGSGWPLDSARVDSDGNPYPWFIESDVDVPVYGGEEDQYVVKLKEGLAQMEARFALPDIAIVVAGSDPYKKDGLESSGPLRLELSQMLERDRVVYEFFKNKKIPQLYVISGGYGEFAHEPYIQFLESVKEDLSKIS